MTSIEMFRRNIDTAVKSLFFSNYNYHACDHDHDHGGDHDRDHDGDHGGDRDHELL